VEDAVVTDRSAKCDYCRTYVRTARESGETVLESGHGEGIHLCVSCIDAFAEHEHTTIAAEYLASLLIPALDAQLDVQQPKAISELCRNLARLCYDIERDALYRVAYAHGAEVERSKHKRGKR
jgi:hypothetical protein